MTISPPRILATVLSLALAGVLGACTQDRIDGRDSQRPATLNPHDLPPISGLDLAGMNTDVRPQDDLFLYANGTWLEQTAIPADKTAWGTFDIVRERTLQQLRELIETDTQAENDEHLSHSQQMVRDLYRDLLDADNSDRADLGIFDDVLTALDELVASDDASRQLPTLFARLSRLGAGTPLGVWISQDRRNSTRHVTYLSQGGLGLPDRDYYFDESEQGVRLREGYADYLQQLLMLSRDDSDARQRVQAVIDLETALARLHWSRVANRDAEKTWSGGNGARSRLLWTDCGHGRHRLAVPPPVGRSRTSVFGKSAPRSARQWFSFVFPYR